MKTLMSLLVLALATSAGSAMADAAATCKTQAAEKKLHGAAQTSFVKKCVTDAGAAAPAAAASSPEAVCTAKAADKKLHGAAKTSFTKKCVADAAK